jgi:hypothetical protein
LLCLTDARFYSAEPKKIDEVLTPTLTALIRSDSPIRERTEHAGAHGPTPNRHVMRQYDEKLDDHEFTEEFRTPLDEEAEEVHEGERAFNVAGNGEARQATKDEVVDTVNTIWRQRFEDDPEGSLDDLRTRINTLGYSLAYAGRTHLAPITERTYYIMDRDAHERIDVFHNGDADLTLRDVCLWSELAFKKWKDSDSQLGCANGKAESGATTVRGTH